MHSTPSSQENAGKPTQLSQTKAEQARISQVGLDAAARFRSAAVSSRHLSDRKHCIRCPCCTAKPEIHRAGWNHHCKTSTHQAMVEKLKKLGLELKVDWITMSVFKCSIKEDLSHSAYSPIMKKASKSHFARASTRSNLSPTRSRKTMGASSPKPAALVQLAFPPISTLSISKVVVPAAN